MDYEKLHKDTIAKLQEMVNSDKITVEIARGICADFTPESEDERIRKELISFFTERAKYTEDSTFNGLSSKEIIAWLEKQCNKDEEILVLKDQIELLHAAIKALKEAHKIELEKQGKHPPIDKIQLGKKYKCIASPRYSAFMKGEIYKPEDKFLCSLMNFCYDCFEPIEDGEQKPADKVEPKFKVGDIVTVKPMSCHGKVFKGEPFKIVDIIEDNYVSDDGKTYSISLLDGWELVKQDSVWSEADEAVLDALIRRLEGEDVYVSPHLAVECLKSLRPQPKQGWSEDDEKKFFDILAILRGGENCYYNSPTLIDWFKSFKERYTWKPSDEQIKALEAMLTVSPQSPAITSTLIELYRQLKKLMEE